MIIEKAQNTLPFVLDDVVVRRCDYRFLPDEELTHVYGTEYGWTRAIGGIFDLCGQPWGNSFYIELAPQLRRAAPKRRAEYFAGRVCATLATKHLTGQFQQISFQEDRSPLWPERIVGSISHTNNHAVALVANHPHYSLLGIDVEEIVNCQDAALIGRAVGSSTEYLQKAPGMTDSEFATLVFSAKEAFYKAVYPLVRQLFDFRDVLVRHVVANKMLLSFREDFHLSAILPEPIYVNFAIDSQHCLCVAYKKRG